MYFAEGLQPEARKPSAGETLAEVGKMIYKTPPTDCVIYSLLSIPLPLNLLLVSGMFSTGFPDQRGLKKYHGACVSDFSAKVRFLKGPFKKYAFLENSSSVTAECFQLF